MLNVLYVHGFGSNRNAGTFLEMKKEFPEHNLISDDFDLVDVSGTLNKIKSLCQLHKIDVIVGKSLGGFYTLIHEGPEKKIVINPCMKPWIEIPKLDNSIPQKLLLESEQLFHKAQENLLSNQKRNYFGIFGDHDHLFSYKECFDKIYNEKCVSLQKSFLINGDHHIDMEFLKPALIKAFEYFDMMDEYDVVFDLMPFYQLVKDDDEERYLTKLSIEERKSIIDSVNHYRERMFAYQNNKI